MGKIKRSEAQKYAKQQKRQAQMQSAAASQKEEGQKMPENRRRERKTFEKHQQTETKLSEEMLEMIRTQQMAFLCMLQCGRRILPELL